MKRLTRMIWAILLSLTLMTLMCPAAFAETPTAPADMELTVTSPSSTVILGGTFTVTATVTNKSASYNLDYFSFTLKYDRTMLNYIAGSANAGSNYTGLAVVDDANGIIVQYIADGTDARKVIDKNGKLDINFTFSPAHTSSAPVAITFDSPRAYCRNSLSNTSTTEGNVLHTFTVNQPYNSLSMTFRTKSSNANLSSLSVKVDNVDKPLSPAFSEGATAYTFSANEPVGAVTIACTCQDPNATYKLVQTGLVYSITVTAEDGTVKTYTVTLNSIPTTTTTTTTTATTTTTTTAATTEAPTTAPTSATQPSEDGTVSDSTIVIGSDKSDGLLASVNISILGLIGLVAGEIGLFMLAFLSGYMTHKNASRPPKITLEDLVAAQAQAEQDSYEDGMEQNDMRDAAMLPDMAGEPFTPQFSPQVSFGQPMDPTGMTAGYDPAAMGMPGMDGSGMQPGFDPNTMGMPGMDGSGMQPGFDPNAMGMPGMDGSGMQPGFDPSAMGMPGMDGSAMQPGFDPSAMGMPGMDGSAMQPGFDPSAMGMPGMNGTMQPGFDPNGMGMPPGYGM